MARVARIAADALTVLSLVMCLAVGGLWVQSFWFVDRVDRDEMDSAGRVESTVIASTSAGLVQVHNFRYVPPVKLRYAHGWRHWSVRQATSGSAWGSLWVWRWSSGADAMWVGLDGRRFLDGSQGGSGRDLFGRRVETAVPLFWVVVAFAIFPVVRLGRRLWRRRERAGYCRVCGYDLRGSVSGVCSECGTAIEGMPTPPEAA